MQNDVPQFNAVPETLETTKEIRDAIDKGAQLAGALMGSFGGAKLARAALAASQLWEYWVRADWRYHDLLSAGSELSTAAHNEDPVLKTRQLQFVDRTEAFHRQIYGTLSVLILFLSHSAPRSVASQLPISSVQKFLGYLQKQPKLTHCSEHFNQLLSSVKYRASLLDHPQQSKLHHWVTMGMPAETVIIHYIPAFEEPVERGVVATQTEQAQYLNPRAPNFRPVIACRSFHVSPESSKTHIALYSTILSVLEWCIEARN